MFTQTESSVCAHVRPVEPCDVTMLQRHCWPDRAVDDVAEFLQRTQRLHMERRGTAVVAQRDHIICGFGMLTVWPHTAEISDLIVAPGLRGQGIGTTIIAYLTDVALDLHVSVLEIGVALSNPRAMALYRRLGFSDRRTIQLELGYGPEPVLYLEKSLPTA